MGDDIIKMRDDVQVLFLKLPNHIKEFVTMNPDMSYTIVLNVNHSHETHLEAYAHALQHIKNTISIIVLPPIRLSIFLTYASINKLLLGDFTMDNDNKEPQSLFDKYL